MSGPASYSTSSPTPARSGWTAGMSCRSRPSGTLRGRNMCICMCMWDGMWRSWSWRSIESGLEFDRRENACLFVEYCTYNGKSISGTPMTRRKLNAQPRLACPCLPRRVQYGNVAVPRWLSTCCLYIPYPLGYIARPGSLPLGRPPPFVCGLARVSAEWPFGFAMYDLKLVS